MITHTIIGCGDELDNFSCSDCRFRDDKLGCAQYLITWKLTPLHESVELIFASDEDEINAAGLVVK